MCYILFKRQCRNIIKTKQKMGSPYICDSVKRACVIILFMTSVHSSSVMSPYMTSPVMTSTEIKMGVILPDAGHYPWSLKRVYPAVDYAIENVIKRQLLPGYNLTALTKDSECSETIGPLAAVDFHVFYKVNVFLGPVCAYAVAPVARFSPHWNIPVLSAGAFVKDFDNKTEYKLLTRVQMSYSNAADFLVNIAETFNWTTLGLIYTSDSSGKAKSLCYFQLEALFHKLRYAYLKEPWHKSFDETMPDSYDFGEILRQARLHSRSRFRFVLTWFCLALI